MVNKIGHYALENTASVYDEEAMSAIELAGRTARKVNECIDVVNEANDYLHKNLTKTVTDTIQDMADDGMLGDELSKAIDSGKVDKGGLGQVTYAMLAQDAREAMTGGNTAVVGVDSVGTVNIADGAVTGAKIAPIMKEVNYHCDWADNSTPLVIIDTEKKTAKINPAMTGNIHLYTREIAYAVILAECTISTAYWDGGNHFSLYYHPNTHVFYLTEFYSRESVLGGCLFLGGVNASYSRNTIVCPVQINGRVYKGGPNVAVINTPNTVKPVTINMERYRAVTNAVFDIDTVNKTITIVSGGEYQLNVAPTYYIINFDTATLDLSGWNFNTNTGYVYYDPNGKRIIFRKSEHDIDANFILLGFINFENLHHSEMIVPFSVDGKYYYSPNKDIREDGKVIYVPVSSDYTKCRPYIDFKGKKLVFPMANYVYVSGHNNFWTVHSGGTDYEIPFAEGDTFQYLVGGSTGMKFITSADFKSLKESHASDGFYYFGWAHTTYQEHQFNFECMRSRSLSIMGDSISTYDGYLKEGYRHYYPAGTVNHVNKMWWKRAMNRCGLTLNTNASYSGSRVTNTHETYPSGVDRAKLLDNGTKPDVIIIALGINDFLNGVTLGDYDGKGNRPTDNSIFTVAYANMLSNVLNTYPSAKVYCCTLMPCQRKDDGNRLPEQNANGEYLVDWNKAIKTLCESFHVEVIDLACCGLTNYNGSTYFADNNSETLTFLHPNGRGQQVIGDMVIRQLLWARE